MPKVAHYLGLVVAALFAPSASAQTIQQITFEEAVQRAITNNPTVQQAAAGILRAESILLQTRAGARPALTAALSTTVVDPVASFSGNNINPHVQTQTTADLSVPILVPVRWAQRNQAADQVLVSEHTAANTRREIAVATAQAYLAIIANRRLLELNERARDNARAHYEYANQRLQGGVGSRLNVLRAQQELSADEARVEEATLAVRRSQEALGILVAADGPVDAVAEPQFVLPSNVPASQAAAATGPLQTDVAFRPDISLLTARQSAAERVLRDSRRDRLPSVSALFTPQVLAPTGLFAAARSWRLGILASVPLFDAGYRHGQQLERQALLDLVRSERSNAERRATSEIRTAREAVAATERALSHAQAAARQANEVVGITDLVFREGAATNIEVLDAQRQARDADTQAVIAEDALRRARLDLLVATGRFPAAR